MNYKIFQDDEKISWVAIIEGVERFKHLSGIGDSAWLALQRLNEAEEIIAKYDKEALNKQVGEK